MESSLHHVWQDAVKNPFVPAIGKDFQFFVGFSLLAFGIILTGLFSLNRSSLNILLIGVPASLALAYGAVYMICAVGVYV